MSALAAPPRKTPLEQAARPLLRLAQQITGLETTFVTSINWDEQGQKVLYALNEGALPLAEGVTVGWHDSMCRSMFLSGRAEPGAASAQVPVTAGAAALGIKSFFAVPILLDDAAIGTVCGASQKAVSLDDAQVTGLQLIADSLRQLLEVDRDKSAAQLRADRAEQEAAEARTEAKRHATQSQQMERLAHTDALTGLPNRRAFFSRWENESARSARGQYPLALMLIDADNFKTVNDSMGHAKGDAVLRAVGATLMMVARSPDVVARLGGDEFALLTTHKDAAQLAALAESIRQLFAVVAAELGVATTLSIGMVSSDECPREKMLVDADRALYRSKSAGGDAAEMFHCHPSPATVDGVVSP